MSPLSRISRSTSGRAGASRRRRRALADDDLRDVPPAGVGERLGDGSVPESVTVSAPSRSASRRCAASRCRSAPAAPPSRRLDVVAVHSARSESASRFAARITFAELGAGRRTRAAVRRSPRALSRPSKARRLHVGVDAVRGPPQRQLPQRDEVLR